VAPTPLAPSIVATPTPTPTPSPAPIAVKPKVTVPKRIKAGRTVQYKVKLTAATGKVSFVVKGKGTTIKKTAKLKQGTAKLSVKLSKAGKYKISWTYAGSKTIKAAKGSSTVTVN
jgi:hypothetical protein